MAGLTFLVLLAPPVRETYMEMVKLGLVGIRAEGFDSRTVSLGSCFGYAWMARSAETFVARQASEE